MNLTILSLHEILTAISKRLMILVLKYFIFFSRNNNSIDLWPSLWQDLRYISCFKIIHFPRSKYNFKRSTWVSFHSGGTRMSDHKYIKVEFQINLNLRGPGYWKFKPQF